MLINANNQEAETFDGTVFDVCICGAGPAGITLARQLARDRHRVALLEAGGLELTKESQELYDGQIVGHPYHSLERARLRYFGGSSNHWAGYTRPLDARDFKPLGHDPHNAWPVDKRDLDPYATEAFEVLDLSNASEFPVDLIDANEHDVPTVPYLRQPTRFGEKYRAELVSSELIHLYLNANLVEIQLAPNNRSVTSMLFRSYEREKPFSIRAKTFVLCLGGIENPRTLLNANRQLPHGIGNQFDQVGRYFCDHLEVGLGQAIVNRIPGRAFYISSDRVMRAEECLPFQLIVSLKGPASRKSAKDVVCRPTLLERLSAALRSETLDCFDVEVGLYGQQANNPDSRVLLSGERDRFGLRRSALDWRLTELDYHTIRAAALFYGRHLAQTNIGRMRLEPYLRKKADKDVPVAGAYHHMCTTRMSENPKTGVVDRNCRVHGIENLFVGGSSVFSSSGLSNPTYTIVQLALRLGDHLHSMLQAAQRS